MACNRNRGEIVDLEARRTRKKQEQLTDASRNMLRAEEALFDLLREVGREDRRRKADPRPSPRAKRLDQTRELPAIARQDGATAPSDPRRGRVLPFRRVRAA
jgi:hypothetical protein